MFVQLVSPAVCVSAIGAVNGHLYVGWVRSHVKMRHLQLFIMGMHECCYKITLFTFSVGLRLGAGEGCSGFARVVVGSSVSPAGKTIPGGSGERVGG